ncbi:PE family protein, partial [Mycobacterium gordonae]
MSFVVSSPDVVASAASDLARLGSTIRTANSAAAATTTRLLPAAADEVSTAVAALFGQQAQSYQALSLRAAAFHEQFVAAITSSAASYATAETANAGPLQLLLDAINAPTQTLLGRPLIGNGAAAPAGSGQNGGDAGILIGNGGNGGSGTLNQGAAGPGGNGGAAGLLWGRGGNGGAGANSGNQAPGGAGGNGAAGGLFGSGGNGGAGGRGGPGDIGGV